MGLFENDFKDEFYSRDERILDLVLDIALGQNKVFLYQKEEEYQISKSTLDEDMRRLRTLLKEYGVEVLSIPKQGLVFEAKERIIRTMLYSLVNKAIDNVALIDPFCLNKLNSRNFNTCRLCLSENFGHHFLWISPTL